MNRRWQLPRFCLANVRSLRYKVDKLAAVLQVNKINIGCITESWSDSNIANEAVDIDGFTCYRRFRTDGRQAGGVVCYVDANWPCVRLQSLEVAELETIWLLVRRPIIPRQISHIRVKTEKAESNKMGWPSGICYGSEASIHRRDESIVSDHSSESECQKG